MDTAAGTRKNGTLLVDGNSPVSLTIQTQNLDFQVLQNRYDSNTMLILNSTAARMGRTDLLTTGNLLYRYEHEKKL
jgi:hypothetical protein